jgi:hypothetical protein
MLQKYLLFETIDLLQFVFIATSKFTNVTN